jgi:hypothetical protein
MGMILISFEDRRGLFEPGSVISTIEDAKETLFSEAGFGAKPPVIARA